MPDTSTKPILVRQDPPPSARGRGQNREFYEAVKAAGDGEWYKATFDVSSTPAKRPGFEFTTRQIPDSDPPRHQLYARYIEPATVVEPASEPL